MDVGITKMSSKGQVVIPSDLRYGFSEGEKFLVIREEETLIIKKINNLDKKFKEDLDFARRTEKAFQEIERGNYEEMDIKEFLDKARKW